MNNSSVEVIESRITRRLLTTSSLLIGACIILFIGWTVFTKVDEIAKAKGAVIPEGERQVIQSELGGKLKHIFVKRGQLVNVGDPIVEFDATFQTTALEELHSKEATLRLRIERKTAFIEEREPDFSQYEKDYPDVVAEQRAQLKAARSLFLKKRIVLQKESERIDEELKGVISQLPAEVRQLESSQKELDILLKGQKTGNISQVRVLEMRQKIAALESEYEQSKSKKAVLIKQAESNKSKEEQLKATGKLEVSKERAKAVSELSALYARLRSGRAKVENTLVTSPVKGLVQSLPTTRNGGVIKPGGTVVEIVPIDGTSSFKAKLSPRDVGFVSVGQAARVKVDAFDYSRFGALQGKVSEISPTTSQTQRGEIYYDVIVELDKGYFGDDPARFRIIPGMTGEANITTGEKTVFQYLWKPIYTNVSHAFGER
ncbi:HlyD family type I secretion periplasmic adaptor subunit [Vibrio neonatus]|uniref:HlyD family type I secretion periplasmic adaptor subunit n=1 Tax=Vibrio neonatus TaxID=278860 RepID=UPI0021C48835|nr:HlyD family type I secretion periplasmic adaptor subunit [Vibrio neonatus]